ncbi:MAG: hypothetical protein A2Y15_03955 [Clostridiales bacterium GWF2_36_10]|nr:MAG: hypothetical protein A2Y15_03955 [Clostridiales bacterium GWF2_36_10]HAN20341.1 hypothetical protein [Clostridiales bacterium]
MKTQVKVKKTGRSIIIRAKISAVIITVLLALLATRLANLQLIDSQGLKNDALEQYSHEIKIEAKRGIIYDRNLKPLAYSATVYNVYVTPNNIKDEAQLLFVADGLSVILNIDKSIIITKLQKKTSKYQIIKKSIEDSEEIQVRTYITKNNLIGIINLEETTKRYYPYSELASQIIGFTGTDNNGLAGIELTYDEYLKGTNGRAIKATDARGNDLPFKYESFIEAQDGLNVVTTIDYTIQSVLEKYLLQAYQDNKPRGAAKGIVMDVNTGEILASAIYPNFDLNNYYKLNTYYQAQLDAFSGTDEEKKIFKSNLLYRMWDNSIVSKTYEPGSTFKMITSSAALEEGVIKDGVDTFVCHTMNVSGKSIHCHSHRSHGTQYFTDAIRNSCNPAFVQIGLKTGTDIFMQYFSEFGYTKPSESDIIGEAKSIYFETTNTQFKELELAVYSFGQTFKVTPIQHLRAVSTVANGGDLITPHVVKALVDNNGNTVKTFEFKTEKEIISQETSSIILKALTNSAKNACVNGYNVVSKTGTSEIRDTEIENDYISSCITFAPAEDPQIAIIVMVEEPTAGPYYGSLVAAPVISSVLGEVLPYLGFEPTYPESENITLESYIGAGVEESKTVLKGLGINCIVKGNGNIITNQMPAVGTILTKDGVVVLYTDDTEVENTVLVPNVLLFTPSAANKTIINNNLNISIKGIFNGDFTNCTVTSQYPVAGEQVAPGTVIEVEYRYNEKIE